MNPPSKQEKFNVTKECEKQRWVNGVNSYYSSKEAWRPEEEVEREGDDDKDRETEICDELLQTTSEEDLKQQQELTSHGRRGGAS